MARKVDLTRFLVVATSVKAIDEELNESWYSPGDVLKSLIFTPKGRGAREFLLAEAEYGDHVIDDSALGGSIENIGVTWKMYLCVQGTGAGIYFCESKEDRNISAIDLPAPVWRKFSAFLESISKPGGITALCQKLRDEKKKRKEFLASLKK